MRHLVSGVAGFIGSHLCDRLLADGHEVAGKEPAHPVDQVIAQLRPDIARLLIAQVVAHLAGDGREQGQVAPALLLQLELSALDGGADLVIRDLEVARLGAIGGIVDMGELLLAPGVQGLGHRREVTVAIDNHGVSS